MNDFDDQLSRSLGERAGALSAADPDVFDVRRRVGHQRNLRRAVAGTCALVLVVGAGAAIALSANRTNAPAAADGEATTVPAPEPSPTSTVAGAPIACGTDQLATAGTETFIHLGQPFTPAAGQCLVGTARAMEQPVAVGGVNCVVTMDATTGEVLPPTTIRASAPVEFPVRLPSGCGALTQCSEIGTVPPPPTTVIGGGSFPVVVSSVCSTTVEAGPPIDVQISPTSTVTSNCAAGEVTAQPGDVVLSETGIFELNVGQCVVATPQPLGTIATCTVVTGTNMSGYESSGTVAVRVGSVADLGTVPGQPAPVVSIVPELIPGEGCAGGAGGGINVGEPATTVEVIAPTSTVKS